ncbi:MAG: hypothetical protein K2J57_02050 [Bacteroidales bacterium]|nr:hypothetical protein [Bacteroidales bacterium]
MATYIAKTLQGLEPVLAKELKELGATEVKETGNRAVLFEATQRVLYSINYQCRTALRILKTIKSFDIKTQDDLYDEVVGVAWEKIFPVDALMTLTANCIDSVFTNSRFVAQRVKDAVVDRFRRVLGRRPDIDNEYYTIRIEIFMRQNHCEVLLDASGLSLHNRGYRKPNTDAFNEVLASALLKMSDWKPGENLLLPMCGDGLLAMEAAMQACAMPAGYFRKGYSFQYWNDYDANLWKEVKRKANEEMHDPEGEIYAFNADRGEVEKVENFLKRVRMHHDVNLEVFDFVKGGKPDFVEDAKDWTAVVRMPFFGEMQTFEAEDFCTQIGNVLKREYTGARAWVYSNDIEAVKFVGLKPKVKHSLSEVGREARFCGYDIV